MLLFAFLKFYLMKAPLMLRIRTKKGDKLLIYEQVILWIMYVVINFGLFTNNLLLFGTIALVLGIVLITLVLKSYSYLNIKITPERVEIGKRKIPLDQVREIRVLKINGPTADLIVVYEGGETLIEEVKNWKEVLYIFQRYKENIV
ncbi:DUF3093 domain-containing protein [Sulfurisphaera ohwakuensis]|uniref:DUF3093 domain-containing protein n=2 Tax=Sulfurisphaera ohwakuensis TaxID=69656 RepID=A0A650CK73_SULOH|nr:DUF3093 domain-containing protein [Sulfurisphaera ohwakuensis]